LFTLARQNNDGLFASNNPILTNTLPAVPGDGSLSLTNDGELLLAYIDPAIESRIYRRYLPVGPPCSYLAGDINNNGVTNGVDACVFRKLPQGGQAPPLACDCPGHDWLYVAADVNGDCMANGVDVTYLVSYFKGGPASLLRRLPT
jgi:hypothetical protein